MLGAQGDPGAADGHLELLDRLVLPGELRVGGGIRQMHHGIQWCVCCERRPDLPPIAEIGLHRRALIRRRWTAIQSHHDVLGAEALAECRPNHVGGSGDQHPHLSRILTSSLPTQHLHSNGQLQISAGCLIGGRRRHLEIRWHADAIEAQLLGTEDRLPCREQQMPTRRQLHAML